MSPLRPPRPVILVVHLPPLPGSPRAALPVERIAERACADARTAEAAGADGIILENYGDAPFHGNNVPPVTVAAMASVATEVRRCVALPVGLNVLRNDARAALSIAAVTGGSFIRVNVHCGLRLTDQGLVEGRAAETLRLRDRLRTCVAVLADVAVKHSSPLGPEDLGGVARDTAYRGLADGLIVTGTSTGSAVALDALHRVREAVPDRPLYAGSGVTEETIGEVLALADGVIVGTSVKTDGRTESPIDPQRASRLIARAHAAS